MISNSTIATCLTPAGRGAVATINIQGDLKLLDACFFPVNKQSAVEQTINKICYGHWGQEHAEDVVFVRVHDKMAEIHCHGGMAAVERILQDLEINCVTKVTAKKSLNQDDFQGQIEQALQQARTRRTAHILLEQLSILPEQMQSLPHLEGIARRQQLLNMLEWQDFGRHLTKPWQVVFCGEPNVGKSSLMNALVGYSRSVVFDKPGTTRDVVTVSTALKGWPIEFSDTAGLRKNAESLESIGIERAKECIATADLVLFVLDAQTRAQPVELIEIQQYQRSLVVYNKVDLANSDLATDVIAVSALTGQGIDQLAEAIVDQLVPEVPPDSQTFPINEQQISYLSTMLAELSLKQ